MTTEPDVVIVGAGPTGLTAACELAGRGVRVTVVDGAPDPAESPRGSRGSRGSRAKGMQPRTLELLDRMGLAARLVSLGTSDLLLRRYESNGEGHTDHDMHPGAGPTPDSPYGRPLMIPQWRTEQVLCAHLAELGVRVRWGTRATGLTQDDDGIRLSLDGGESLGARYLVGCDGGSSTIRRAVGVGFLGETSDDVRMLLGDLTVDGLSRDRWHIWEPFVGMCPLPATEEFQFQAGGQILDGVPVAADFQRVLDGAGAGHVRVRDVRWASQWRLNTRMADAFRVGRVLLAGDAAHVHSPAGGQGMNTGIGDAVNLGWKLAAVLGGADDALLDSYQAERMPVAAAVLGLSGLLTGRRIEQRGSEGTEALQLGVGYRGGPLAPAEGGEGGERAGTPLAGDRAPDAPVRGGSGDPIRLFDLFRHPDWTLLGFGTLPATPSPHVRAVQVAGPDRDAGAAHRIYGAADGDLVLVRPDGYVALRTRRQERVRSYLAGLVPADRAAPGSVA